jgi:hypothetical protein
VLKRLAGALARRLQPMWGLKGNLMTKPLMSIETACLAHVTGGRASAGSSSEVKAALQSTADAVKDLVRNQQNPSSSSSQMLPMMMVMMMRK